MLPKLTSMKGCRTLCVSIIELQINYKMSYEFQRRTITVKSTKNKQNVKKKLMMKERELLFGFVEVKSPIKIPLPKAPPTTICRITQNYVIIPPPFFVDVINE